MIYNQGPGNDFYLGGAWAPPAPPVPRPLSITKGMKRTNNSHTCYNTYTYIYLYIFKTVTKVENLSIYFTQVVQREKSPMNSTASQLG